MVDQEPCQKPGKKRTLSRKESKKSSVEGRSLARRHQAASLWRVEKFEVRIRREAQEGLYLCAVCKYIPRLVFNHCMQCW